jgi:predicted SAM-dependent methyltransferase
MLSSPNTSPSFEEALEPKEKKYLQFHQKRFTYLTNEVVRLATLHKHPEKPVSVLDIGPHFQTTLIRQALGPSAVINTLGWENTIQIVPPRTVNQHYTFDLNDSPYQERWISCPRHDIVVMAEVFEHLYTAPEYFLGFIRTLLKPGGHLIIGTPNAVALTRRMGILKGRNPYERIRITLNNPGHFREYTADELKAYAEETGFNVESTTLSDFYESTFTKELIKRFVHSLKDSIHIVFQKTDQPDKPVELTVW